MSHEDSRWHSKTELNDPGLLELLERWQEWTRVESIPLRDWFDPADFPRLLPWMILGEILAGAPQFDARIRYIGSEIVNYFNGANLTGTQASDLAAPYARRWSEVGEKAIEARAPLFFHGKPFMVDTSYVPFEMLALPLSKTGQVVDFVILAMAISWRSG